MTLPSFVQHLSVLEHSLLVKSGKRGRVRIYEIVPGRFKVAEDWLSGRRRLWEGRLDRLDDYVKRLKAAESRQWAGRFAINPKLVLERFVDAPRQLVWEALTKPEHLKVWYMPKAWGRVSRVEMDVRSNKTSGWRQGTEIALDQFVSHVKSMK